jgi:hypothetical protein
MKEYALGLYSKYAYFIGGMTVVPTVYLTTGRLLLSITGYSLGYAIMVVIQKFSKAS